MVALLALVVAALLVFAYTGRPNLLYQTECATLDSLRTYAFVLTSAPRETKRCWRYETQQRVLLYLRRDSTMAPPQAGDTIIARTRIQRGDSIGDFDYGLYLRRQGIIGTAYAGRFIHLPSVPPPRPPLQKRLYQRLKAAGLSGDELATTAALTLGYKEDLDPSLKHRFQASGAAHVLAVSGLHTGIIYALLLGLLTLGGRYKPLYEDRLHGTLLSLIIIAALWFYAWLTGLTPSVVRCALMLTIVETGRMLHRQAISLNTIAAAAVLILFVRPLDLWSVGFQLSFAATAAIVIVARDFEPALRRQEWQKPIGRLTSWVAGLLIVSLAAQLGTLPITMCTFGQVSNYFLLTNLIVLPITTLLVPCGLATVALGGCWLGKAVGYITYGLAWLMNHSVAWIEGLPGSVTQVHGNGLMAALLYAAIGMGWLTVHKSLWWLSGVVCALGAFCWVYVTG